MSPRRNLALTAILILAARLGVAEDTSMNPFAKARENYQRGRYLEALEVLDALAGNDAQKDVEPTSIAILRSHIHWSSGERTAAEQAIVDALKQYETAALHAHLARISFDLGKYDIAERATSKALQIDPDHLLARFVLARLLTEKGELKKADLGYHWFVKYYNGLQPDNPAATDAESLNIIAQGAAQYALWHSSAQILDFCVNTVSADALKSDKSYWQSHLVAGRLLLEKYNKAQGRPELKAALVINPNAADVHAELAKSAIGDYNWDEVEESSKRALEISPHMPEALRPLAIAKLYFRDLGTAESLLTEALEVNPVDGQTLAALAALRMLQDGWPEPKRWEQLVEHLEKIADLKLENPSRAEQILIDVASRNPKPGIFLGMLAEIVEMFRQHTVSEPLLRKAIVLMPQLSQPKNALGQLYMQVGNIPEAKATLDQAFKTDPYHVRVSNMRKVIKVLEDYDSISTDHFVVRADGKLDKILARYMAEYLEEIYPELTTLFGFEPDARTQIEIYNTAKGLSGHQWFSARMVGLPWVQTIGASTGVIIAMQSPGSMERPLNWARVLKHEFVHVLTLQQTNFNIPHWYTEALAVRSEGYPRPVEWNKLLLDRVPKKELKNLDNLSMGFIRAGNQENWNFAYCQSFLYAEYMAKRFGEASLARLLDAYRRNLTTDKAVPEVFGVDKAEFEKGYRDYLDEIVAGLRQTDDEQPAKASQIERAYEKNKTDPKAASDYAKLLLLENRRKDAKKLAAEVLASEPSQPVAAAVLAYLLFKEEKFDEAGKTLEPAFNREQPNKSVLDLLMKVRLRQKRGEEAAELCELGKKFFPYDSDWWKGSSAAARLTGDTEKRRSALETLVQIESDDPAPRKALAEMAITERNFDAAIKFAKLTLQIDVLDAEIHRIYAEACRETKDFKRAVTEFETAIELKPKDIESKLGLAETYLLTDRKSEAAKLIDDVLAVDAGNDRALSLRDRARSQ